MCLSLPGKQHFGKPSDAAAMEGLAYLNRRLREVHLLIFSISATRAGHDSVVGREGQRGVDEWVFFRQDQLLPCFLVDEFLGFCADADVRAYG